ncbi:MAG: BtpA/SgcQ family protein [Candidatus Bathyarchaeia archaeon]
MSELLKKFKPIIGMIHLPPLPGSPAYQGQPVEKIVDQAVQEAVSLVEGGIDAVLVENFNDYPYVIENTSRPTIIALSVVAYEVKKHVDVPVGINILFNDAINEFYVAWTLGLDFIRVEGFIDTAFTDLGIIQPLSAKLLRLRAKYGGNNIAILADVQGKHTSIIPTRPLVDSVRDAFERGRADAVVLTGERTGEPVNLATLRAVREKFPNARIFLGSGLTAETVSTLLTLADGGIVGTYFKKDGKVHNPIDIHRVRNFMQAVKELRERKI